MADQAKLAAVLLARARDDLTAARSLLDVPVVADTIVCFHAQQAVEKSLKAALAARGHDFPFTHDLDGLREACITAGLSLPTTLDEIDRLTPYAAHARYGSDDPRTVSRTKALEIATDAVAWAAAVLSTGAVASDDEPSGQ